jgi:DNA-binding transcriptional LysR family regulator
MAGTGRDGAALPRLRDLEAFAATAQCGSLGAAAQALGLSQPALSQALGRLEARLGCRLLRRGPQGSFVSDAGSVLLRRCERMQQQLRAGLAVCRSAVRPGLLTDTAVATHLAVAAAGSFSAAARQRGVTLPTLARSAHGLEACLGLALYRRGAEGVVPLPSGLELARRFALARVEMEQGLAELAAEGAEERFRLGVLPMVPQEPLAQAAAAAPAGLPLRFSIHDGDHPALIERLRHGRLDAVIGAVRPPPAHDDLLEEHLADDPFVLAAAATHPLADGRPVTPADLAEDWWVVAEPPLPRRRAAEALFAACPRRPRILLETNMPQTTIALLRETRALALLSRQQIAATPGLAALPVRIAGPSRFISLTLRHEWLPTRAQEQVLQALRVAFRTTG